MPIDTTVYPIEDISDQHANAETAVRHAINLLEQLLAKQRYVIGTGQSRQYLELRRDMPYVIHQTSSPRTYILVNRNYKPLGNNSRTHENYVSYEEHSNGHVFLTRTQIASVVSPGREMGLFGDENPPWANRKAATEYLVRLRSLLKLLSTQSTSCT
jgi:hypothetical protein